MSKKLNQAILNLELLDKIMDKKLPWIKITPETELPINKPVLVKTAQYLIGRFGIATDGYFFQEKDGFIFAIEEVTHYCIITNPE